MGNSNVLFAKLFGIAAAIIATIYVIKYISLSLFGWIFNAQEAAYTYKFIVFLINKIGAIALVPFVWLLAYSSSTVQQVVVTIASSILILLVIYRYIVGVNAIRNSLQISALHFFLYFCAAEVLPLLLIYKTCSIYTHQIY